MLIVCMYASQINENIENKKKNKKYKKSIIDRNVLKIESN